MHLDRDDAVALARLAAPALDVEGKAPRAVAAHPGFGQLREQVADVSEQPGVGGRVGSRRAPDRALIDVDNPVQVRDTLDALVRAPPLVAAVEPLPPPPVPPLPNHPSTPP